MPVPPVIINNTPLVALWTLDRLDLLSDLFGTVWLPTAVAPLVQQLLDQGLYFSPELVSRTLTLAGE
jgi:predicted nucleic acid-binding protein